MNLNGNPKNAAQRLMMPLWIAAAEFSWRDYRCAAANRGTPPRRHKKRDRRFKLIHV